MFNKNDSQYEKEYQVTDTVLRTMQQNNELVLAFAIETWAWAKTVNYKILVKNNNGWKAFIYYKNNTNNSSMPPKPVAISDEAADAVWKFMQDNEVWKVKGDNGENFCTGDKKNDCNINDGVTWRLLILTKYKVIDPSYYEPEFYENCCPGDVERKLFIEAANKIKDIVNSKEVD